MRLATWVTLLTIVIACVATIASTAVFAVSLTTQEAAGCQTEGGCEVVSAAWLRSQLTNAFSAGYKAGKEGARCARPMT
jgi:hypothetical protein